MRSNSPVRRAGSTPQNIAVFLVLASLFAVVATACGSSTSASVSKIDPTTTTTAAASDTPQPTTTLEPEASTGTMLYVYTPIVGDCIDHRTIINGKASTTRTTPDPNATLRSSGQVIVRLSCDLPHQYEVLWVDTTEVAKSPPESPEAFGELAKRVCPEQFASSIGRPYQDSSLDYGWISPTVDQLAQGIQFLGCLAFDPKDKLTGSVRSSNR
jgi:hypothetical protein